MKVFHKTTLCLFFLIPFFIFSQENELLCATQDIDISNPNNNYSNSIDPNTLSLYEPVVYNIFFWGINDDNGNGNNQIVEDDVLEAIANINIAFNDSNIFFKYKGFDHINSSVFDTITFEPFADNNYLLLYPFVEENGYEEDYSFNVYIPQHFEGASGAGPPFETHSIVRYEAFLKPILIHELGHNFNLAHTFQGWDYLSNCEHVTRNPEDDNYNAHERGDAVIDTPAQNQLWGDVNPNTCEYIGNGQDCEYPPVLYEIASNDVRNFMGYGGLQLCGDQFTIGQKIRMREAIVDDYYNNFEEAETEVEALYKPYKGEYYVSGPSTSNNPPLFQPGFEYRFVSCEGDYPSPSDYDDITFPYNNNTVLASYNKDESNYGNITHPNHSAIGIKHEIGNVFWPQPRKCYDNYNKASSGGLVMKFNDNVFNNNVTITPKDSTAINNQNLIQELPSGLFKIEKSYDDGSTQETIILKENN